MVKIVAAECGFLAHCTAPYISQNATYSIIVWTLQNNEPEIHLKLNGNIFIKLGNQHI